MNKEKIPIEKANNLFGVIYNSKITDTEEFFKQIGYFSNIRLIWDMLEKMFESDELTEYVDDLISKAIILIREIEDSILRCAIYYTDKKDNYIWNEE